MLGELGEHSCSALNLLLRLLDQPDKQNYVFFDSPDVHFRDALIARDAFRSVWWVFFFSVPCLIYLAVLWPVSVSLPPFFAQTRSFCSFLFSQRIAYSEEAACRYLKTARTSLAAWIIPFLFFSPTWFLFNYLQVSFFCAFDFAVLSLLLFFSSISFPNLLCSVAQLR